MRVIENVIMTAASAASGANQQPWRFVVVRDPIVKRKIVIAAGKKVVHKRRAPYGSIAEVASLRTNLRKAYLEGALYQIIVFKKIFGVKKDVQTKHYNVSESVGISGGILLAAIHQTGLVVLTHTPSPMAFLARILNRAPNEKAYPLIPVGCAEEDVECLY